LSGDGLTSVTRVTIFCLLSC